MCMRYALYTPMELLARQFGFRERPNLEPRYNLAPTQPVVTVCLKSPAHGERPVPSMTLMRWGLVPSWSREPMKGANLFNARSETVAEKPAFKGPFRRRRCLIPLDGFYEWSENGQQQRDKRQPWFIRLKSREPFALAGIWDDWLGADGSEVQSCAILTTAAGPDIRHLHHRSPVLVPPAYYNRWLWEGGELFLRAPPAGVLEAFRVSTRVNAVRHDDPACMEALQEEEDAEASAVQSGQSDQFSLF
ncbi:SOS response-associated peptidase [Kiloniella sp. b19]|uniref:SOS response-associated peptidase n=1 Tax=Kiloniella sp. GXU_MW_B19 TaxID=3141326 RepID=UPI0031D43E7D